MVRLLDKDFIIKVLNSRPAFIKSMKNPNDPAFLARCIMADRKAIQFIDPTWLTLPVLQALLPLLTSSAYYLEDRLGAFPLEVRNAITDKELKSICNERIEAIEQFPNAAHHFWLKRVKGNSSINFSEIPVQHRTESLLIDFFITHNAAKEDVPDEVFTDKLLDRLLEKDPDQVNYIPEKFLTATRLERAFRQKPDLELVDKLPDTVWNQTNADLAMGCPGNISDIPDQYKHRKMCLDAVTDGGDLLAYIPKALVDEEIIITAMTSKVSLYSSTLEQHIPKKFLTRALLMKLAQKDRERNTEPSSISLGVGNYLKLTGKALNENTWVEVLKVTPTALRNITKPDQTDAIIKTFIENAPIMTIDYLVSHGMVNLTKLKKEYTPLLVSTSLPALQDLITRKLNPPSRTRVQLTPDQPGMAADVSRTIQELNGQSGTGDKAMVDITDSELIELTKKFS